MGKKIVYKQGDPVNKEGNLIYISEAEPHISSKGYKERRILVKDLDAPEGNNIFIASVGSVRCGSVKHAPSVRKELSYDSRRHYKFQIGDFVNPSQTLIYLGEGEPKLLTSGERKRTLRVQDIYSAEIFDCLVSSAVHDRVTMGPLHRKERHIEVIKEASYNNRKYKEGDLIKPHILFVKELPSLKDAHGIPVRYGKFYNVELDVYFFSRLRSVLYNNIDGRGELNLYSAGERKIKKILDENNIEYKREYSFHDCINPKTNKRLRFDFYLIQDNILIEFDGEQHYKSTGGWNSKEAFKERAIRDAIKNKYTIDNSITLIRIPYWDLDKLDMAYLEERGVVSASNYR